MGNANVIIPSYMDFIQSSSFLFSLFNKCCPDWLSVFIWIKIALFSSSSVFIPHEFLSRYIFSFIHRNMISSSKDLSLKYNHLWDETNDTLSQKIQRVPKSSHYIISRLKLPIYFHKCYLKSQEDKFLKNLSTACYRYQNQQKISNVKKNCDLMHRGIPHF